MIELTLTTPPSVNRLWRTKQGGGMYRSKEYMDWRKSALWELAVQYKGAPLDGPYRLTLLVEKPDNRRRDLANLEKALSDILQEAKVITDDKYCYVLHMEWAGKGHLTHIKLEGMDGQAVES